MVSIIQQTNECINTISYEHIGDAHRKGRKRKRVAEHRQSQLKAMELERPHLRAFIHIDRQLYPDQRNANRNKRPNDKLKNKARQATKAM